MYILIQLIFSIQFKRKNFLLKNPLVYVLVNMNDIKEKEENYTKQKMAFLDNLQPDDFRNGGSFNDASGIIEQINKAYYKSFINDEGFEEFLKKALGNLFRENSDAINKAINLANSYLKMKSS